MPLRNFFSQKKITYLDFY